MYRYFDKRIIGAILPKEIHKKNWKIDLFKQLILAKSSHGGKSNL